MTKPVKIIILTAVLIAIIIAVYRIFFYIPSAQQEAEDYGLYTGDTLHDTTLTNIINSAQSNGGAIAEGNMEWLMQDAANKMAHPELASEDWWRVNGALEPVGALMASIMSTADWKEGVPVSQDLIDRYNELVALNDGKPLTEADWQSYTDVTATAADVVHQIGINDGSIQSGDAFIPQTSRNILWEIFNNYKNLKENTPLLK